MLTNYFTLRALTRELNSTLRDSTLRAIFTQHKNEILFFFELHSGVAGDSTTARTLTVSIDPKNNFLFLREGAFRARKNSVDLFTEATPATIESVDIHPHDRNIRLVLTTGLRFSLRIFGTAESNILLTDEHGIIRAAFKNTRQLSGKRLEVPSHVDIQEIIHDSDRFRSVLLHDHARSTFAALKSIAPLLGSTLAREILHRSGAEEKALLTHLESSDVETIRLQTIGLFAETELPRSLIYFRDEHPSLFSILPLSHHAGSRSEEFPTVNDGIRTFVLRSFHVHAIDAEKKDLLKKINGELDRTERGLQAVEEELAHAARADEYEHIAKVIMANIQHLTRGTKAVDIEDPFHGGRLMNVVLDPKLMPAQNAEQYFAKAKKARIVREESFGRAEMMRTKRSRLETLLLHLDNCQTREQVEEFKEENIDNLQAWNLVSKESEGERIPFRVFKVVGGFEVWVGKSSENNDLLTTKYARPHDLWFHARGSGGSHTILRVGSGPTKPSKEAIHATARIAAYYSKMKKAHTVPVAYCEKKYVRKPKGANPGTVVMEREKVIFVEPGLPQQ